MEYLKSIYERYRKGVKEKKTQILEEFCQVNKYNRKYAIRLLNGPPPEPKKGGARRKPFLYSAQAIAIAGEIWEKSGYLCGQRLKEAIPLWLPAARKRYAITPEIEKELLTISSRQLDHRLRARKRKWKKQIYSLTWPGTFLKSMIPIRTHNWDIKKPGYLENDLVAHCGNSNDGVFVNTLTATDIETGWTERAAILGKGQHGVFNGLLDIKNNLPFRLRGIDSDNGEEFINYLLLRFCRKSRPQIAYTRGRAYKKNDNAHVEQKNWTHVRQIFGWDRYDTEVAQAAINDLYENELRLFQNLFQPSLKLKQKIRIGSKVIRKYDPAKTPLQRVINSGAYHRAIVKKLKTLRDTLDPFELSKTIDQKLGHIFKLASQRIRTKKQMESLQQRALDSSRTNENGTSHGQLSPAQRAYGNNFQFSREGRWLKKTMVRLKREAALFK
jgi:hypothetical protein